LLVNRKAQTVPVFEDFCVRSRRSEPQDQILKRDYMRWHIDGLVADPERFSNPGEIKKMQLNSYVSD